jgi:hypothetical protein
MKEQFIRIKLKFYFWGFWRHKAAKKLLKKGIPKKTLDTPLNTTFQQIRLFLGELLPSRAHLRLNLIIRM